MLCSIILSILIPVFLCGGLTATLQARTPSFQGLGDLPGGEFRSHAKAVSGDGLVVVGYSVSDFANSFEAFRWTAGSGMTGLGELEGGHERSLAYDVSQDGSVIVGRCSSSWADPYEAFKWTEGGDMIELTLCEVGDGLGMLAGQGFFEVTGGSLQEDFVHTQGDIFQMVFRISPNDVDDFSAGFTGFTDITVTPAPEPATLGILLVGALAVVRRKRRR